ncbi:PepSY domain-containing protein [Nesterenkonia marinintestina]|uniref:PepSY domain-containing protein n=1 Tax=Nesterenkonia marinintestina TaxID=2979865 RepID=UPI0021C07469|nr:PepSY domain-containing protein [Nesterenkonia sp. GX14115]
MDTITRRSGLTALSTAAVAALMLTACDSADEALDAGDDNEPESNVTVGADEGDEQDDEQDDEQTEESDDEATDEATGEEDEDGAGDGAEDVENHPVYGGLSAVEAEYPDGIVFEIDDEDSSYEWHVYSEGTVYEVKVDKQSLEIVSTEEDGAPGDEEQSELDAIEVGLEEALRSIEDRAGDPSGAFVDEVELDTEDGLVVWEIELADGTELDVDVSSGDVVGEESD